MGMLCRRSDIFSPVFGNEDLLKVIPVVIEEAMQRHARAKINGLSVTIAFDVTRRDLTSS
jgi:hypothetical protein